MRRVAILAAVTAAACLAAAPAHAVEIYVALGDSFTAGPLIPNPKGDPIDCGQSDHNYPTLVANEIEPGEFRDVSCGSARTEHMTEPQTGLPLGGTNPPQFGALDRRVDLVTVGIGGNDMGFGGIVETCARLGIESGGQGRPCTDHYNEGDVDRVAERLHKVVAPRLAAVLEGIQDRSPKARLLAVGYPDPVPQDPGCYPAVPLARGDLPWLHTVAGRLSGVVERRARRAGAEYVELLPGSIGHDICQPPGTKWYEGIVPTSPAYPAHPNALGMEFAARETLAVLARPIPNRFRVLRRAANRRGRIALRIRAPYRGRFRVRARHGKRRYAAASAFAPRARKLRILLRPTAAGRRALARRGAIKVRLRVRFDPVAGPPRVKRTGVRIPPR